MSEISDLEDIDFGAILSAPVRRAGQTLKSRRAIDKQKLSTADRLKVQTTGRTEQMNLRVHPMVKREFQQEAEALDILPTELFEKAWNTYKAAKPAPKKKG